MENQGKIKILVAEDDSFLRKSVSRFIKQNGYVALEAVNGLDALEIFRRDKPALVLTDLRMPVMSGFDLIKEVVRESPETPIIIFSGIGQEKDIEIACESGAIDYIAKPVEDVDFLIERVQKALLRTQTGENYSVVKPEPSSENIKIPEEKNQVASPSKFEAQPNEIEWQDALDSLDEPLAVLDCQYRIVKINKAMARVLGGDAEEIIGTIQYVSTKGVDNEQQARSDLDLLLKDQHVSGKFYHEVQHAYYDVKIKSCLDSKKESVVGFVYFLRDMSRD